MKASEFEDNWDSAITPESSFWDKEVIMLTPSGHTYPITGIHYNESLDVFVITAWPEEKTK